MTIETDLKSKRPDDWGYPNVVIYIPMERTISYADTVFPNFMGIAQRGFHFIWGEYTTSAIGRNKAAIQLLATDFTHILMLDLDHQHPVDIVERLAKWVVEDRDVKVVGGLNFQRRPPYLPCAFLDAGEDKMLIPTEWERGILTEVAMLGTGCILISREVFEDIEPPWFTNDFSHWDTGQYAGDDATFSKRCRQNKIKLWCDPDTNSPHIDTYGIGEETFRSWYAMHGIGRP